MATRIGRTSKTSLGFRREDQLQKACVRWFRLQYPNRRKRLIASLNGAPLSNGAKTAGQLKAMGMTPGEADLFLAIPSGDCGGLFIEMKTHSKHSRQSENQKDFEKDVTEHYGYAICRDLDEFINTIKQYLETGEY